MTTEYADFNSHHIEGIARAAEEKGVDGWFKVPLISHIKDNLWMGGCSNMKELPLDFAHVVSLYPWERYRVGPKTELHEFEMYDSAKMANDDWLHWLADRIQEWMKDGKVLVHCQAGLNRSGLMSALTLIHGGMKPTDAIALLREKRCDMVLCNQKFEEWLWKQVPM